MRKFGKRNALGLALGLTLALGTAGCGSSSDSTTAADTEATTAAETTAAAAEAETEAETEAAATASSADTASETDGSGFDSTVDYDALSGKTITVAASPVPHAEILKEAAKILKEKNITLDVQEFDDYVQPNNVVESGEVDFNYFQHVPYLEDFNKENGTHLVAVAGVHIEPMAIYSGGDGKNTLDDIKDGATIAVPNDTTNEARALLLLQREGIITLKDGAGITATANDIEDNPHNVKLQEVEAAQVPRVLQDVDYAVINSNYAIEANLNPVKDSLAIEDSTSDYVNVLVTKEGNENSDEAKALKAALLSDDVRDFINEKYDGSVIPVF